MRRKYDSEGKSGINEANLPKIDPTVFFNMLFGSEKFDGYTGEIAIGVI